MKPEEDGPYYGNGAAGIGALSVPLLLLGSLAHSVVLFLSLTCLIFSVLFLYVFTKVKKPKLAVLCWCITIALVSYILFGIFDF